MKLAVANDMLHIVESGALRKVRSDFGSDPIRTLLEESIDLVGLYDLAEPPRSFASDSTTLTTFENQGRSYPTKLFRSLSIPAA